MKPDKKEQKQEKQGLQDQAINKKGKASDGKEINHQVEQKREKHQPRDNA